MASKAHSIDRGSVLHIGGLIMSGQLAGLRDPASRDDAHMDRLADLSVRAALALEAAIPRAEERLAKEAEEAEVAKVAAAKAAEDAEKAAKASEPAADAKKSK